MFNFSPQLYLPYLGGNLQKNMDLTLDEEIEGNIINSANTLNDSISATKA